MRVVNKFRFTLPQNDLKYKDVVRVSLSDKSASNELYKEKGTFTDTWFFLESIGALATCKAKNPCNPVLKDSRTVGCRCMI